MDNINILFVILFIIIFYLVFKNDIENYDATITTGSLNLPNGWSISTDVDTITFKNNNKTILMLNKYMIASGNPEITSGQIFSFKDWIIYPTSDDNLLFKYVPTNFRYGMDHVNNGQSYVCKT